MPNHNVYDPEKARKYPPFDEHEKEEILLKQTIFLRTVNESLRKAGKEEIDETEAKNALRKKLNDPKVAMKFRLVKEIKENQKKQEELGKALAKKYPLEKGQADYLSRSISYLLKTDGSSKSEKYNEKIFQDYQKDPKAFAYARMKTVLSIDANEMIERDEDEISQLEWVRDNPVLSHETNEFGDPIKPSGFEGKSFGTNKILGDNLPSLASNFQKVNYAGSVTVSKYSDVEYLVIPDNIDKDLAFDIMNNTKKYFGKDFRLSVGMRVGLQDKAGFYDNTYSVKDIADKLRDINEEPGKDMLLKYYAVKENPQTGKDEQVPISDWIEDKPGVRICERSQSDIERIKHMNKDFDLKYNFEFQKRMGPKVRGGSYNIFRVLKDHRSGFFSRDSQEYKEFAKALADFTNPEKEGYLDKAGLRDKVNAYLEHTEQVKPGKNETDPVRRGRRELANNVLDTLREMDRDGVEHEITNEMVKGATSALNIQKEPAFEGDSFFDISLEEEDPRNKLIDIPVNKKGIDEPEIDNNIIKND